MQKRIRTLFSMLLLTSIGLGAAGCPRFHHDEDEGREHHDDHHHDDHHEDEHHDDHR